MYSQFFTFTNINVFSMKPTLEMVALVYLGPPGFGVFIGYIILWHCIKFRRFPFFWLFKKFVRLSDSRLAGTKLAPLTQTIQHKNCKSPRLVYTHAIANIYVQILLFLCLIVIFIFFTLPVLIFVIIAISWISSRFRWIATSFVYF